MIYKILSILGFVFFSNLLLYHSFGSTGVGIFILGLYIFLVGFYKPNMMDQKGPLAIFNGFSLFVLFFTLLQRSNGIAQTVLIFSMLGMLGVILYLNVSRRTEVRSLMEYLMIPFRLFGTYIQGGLHVLSEIFNRNNKTESAIGDFVTAVHKSKFFSIIIGVIVGIPLIGLLLTFFSSADPIFAATIQKIFSQDFLSTIPFRIIFSLIMFGLLLPFLSMHLKDDFRSPIAFLEKFNFVREASVVMTMVAATVAFFLIIQAPYVFVNVAAETDLSRYGVATYSEYVKRGFFELLQASVLLYGITWLGLIILRGKKSTAASYLRVVQIIMVFLFFIFLISLFRRVWLYQDQHGWTLARLYGSFLLLWISGVTLTLLLRHFIEKRWSQFEVVFTVLLVLAIGYFNAEQFIVHHHPPTVNKRIDHIYLSRLSADGFEGWQEAHLFAQNTLQNAYGTEFLNKDARRDIAYSGVIVNNLLQQYDDLVKIQGTSKELYDYYLIILTDQVVRYDNLLGRMTRYDKTDIELREEGLSVDQKYRYKDYQAEKASLVKEIETLKERQKKNLPFEISQQYYYIGSEPKRLFVERPEEIESFIITPTTFEGARNYYLVEARDLLDKVYTFNFSDGEGYEFLKTQVTLQNLLDLQTKYYEYAKRINAQPQNERSYEADVSTESPFLRLNQPNL